MSSGRITTELHLRSLSRKKRGSLPYVSVQHELISAQNATDSQARDMVAFARQEYANIIGSPKTACEPTLIKNCNFKCNPTLPTGMHGPLLNNFIQ